MTPEAALVKKILEYLNTVGFAHKVRSDVHTIGRVDIVGCVQGRALALEVKVPGGEPTPRQARELACWRAAGALTGCVHSVEETRALLVPFLDAIMKRGAR